MFQLMSRGAAIAGLTLSLAVGASSADAAAPVAPANLTLAQVYAPPASMVAGAPGSIVWARPVPVATNTVPQPVNLAPTAATSTRLIYRSVSIGGAANVESASVYTPTAPAPSTGYKIIAWDHVTTGGAELCAPSLADAKLPDGTTDNPEFERLTRSNNVLRRLLNAGYVVVRPDYEGIGTPGPHPYMIAKSLARATVDAVRATRAFVGNTSNEYGVVGHSEGGVAALSTSAWGATYAPELSLKATAAITPVADLKNLVFNLGGALPISSLSSFGGLMLNGARLSDSWLGAGYPWAILTAEGTTRMAHIETKCLAQLSESSSLGGLTFDQLFLSTAGLFKSALYSELDRNDIRNMSYGREPIRMWAGGVDLLAPASLIVKAKDNAVTRGSIATETTYPWATHVTITDEDQAGPEIADWLHAQLG